MHTSEWEQSNVNTAYPFEKVPVVQDGVKRVFVDALVHMAGERDKIALTAFSVAGMEFTISTVFAASGATFVNGSGTLRTFGRWGVASVSSGGSTMMVTVNLEETGTSWSLSGAHLVFAVRCVEAAPARVNRVAVEGTWYTGNIVFAMGHNIEISHGNRVTVGRDRTGAVLAVTARAGAGIGVAPGECVETGADPTDLPLQSINRVRPRDDGAFFFHTE